MEQLEQLLLIFLAGVALAALARRVGAPYPVFLAIGGAALALLPNAPSFTMAPDLALAIFVAPVLLDAAYDASVRDLRDNWLPVASLVVVAVALTTAAVAAVAHALVPSMPWPAAVALGALVAPPDAVAATAVLRQVRPPQRIITVLEGESLLNDATALLIYRVAVGAVAAGSYALSDVAPAFLLGVVGSLVAGPVFAWAVLWVSGRIDHVPTAIIVQFVSTLGVWLAAEALGLSAVLTTVVFAIALARKAPQRISARMRIPTNAVWNTAVFALNILAFVFIGLQLRPILDALAEQDRARYLEIAVAVLVTVIVVRMAWHMSFNAVVRWRIRRSGRQPRKRVLMRPTVGSGLVISWSGMRGIVTLAAAMALPVEFPFRDLILFTAFAVVLGTLAIQGLTLKPLLKALDLHDDDPVGREWSAARERALQAALASLEGAPAHIGAPLRKEFQARLGIVEPGNTALQRGARDYSDIRLDAIRAARDTIIAMRGGGEIGDDAFHCLEQELDWLEMTS
ncbi:MAG TPA: cation:proton antiporter [Usitatibacter sp.]|nr:cation:proton antiporter [Usitatibacter sp.]